MKTRIIASFLVVVGCCVCSKTAAQPIGKPISNIFVSVLAEVKAETKIPVLLPTALPMPSRDAKHAMVAKVSADEYAVSLYYELGVGNAGFAASFAATRSPKYSVRDLPNVREVKLARGGVGFFRPVSCGGSCAPANLWWKEGAFVYQVQLRLSSTLDQKKQLKVITEVADSAILAGPR